MSIKIAIALFLITACSQVQGPHKPHAPKEFSSSELILGTQLLTKIFDMEMAPIACVPDTDEASLLLRTIRPRMEVVQDDMEAMLDNPKDVDALINTCDKTCTCSFVDDLLKEHLVTLTKTQRKSLTFKKTPAEINRCMTQAQENFCKSELYLELNKEKVDFSFDE